MAYPQYQSGIPDPHGNPADFQSNLNVLNLTGAVAQVGTPTVNVKRLSNLGTVKECSFAGAPTNGDAGYDTGCLFFNTNAVGPVIYTNTGTSTSAAWSSISSSSAGAGNSAAINSTASATAAQVATGRITSTSAAATTITLPTGTLLGAAIGAVAGTVFDLIIDNTAGASTVTMAVAVNGIKSDAANTTAASFGQLTVASGVTGVGRFTLTFSSPTAYVFTRTA